MTTSSENIIGLFVEPDQADAAIVDLEAHGFTPYHIRSSDKRPIHDFLTHIKRVFTKNTSDPDDESQPIEELDIRHEDVLFYEHEMTEGHVLVALTNADNLQEALDILQTHGAMTNYPLTLYASSHNQDINAPHISRTDLSTNEQASLSPSSTHKQVTETPSARLEDNAYKSVLSLASESIPLVQKSEKPDIHARPKPTHKRSSQI